jgi:site-specific DNA recombinase
MVRELFDLYLQHHSMLRAAQEANRRGWSTKSYVTRKGVHKGGGRFDKAKLQRILTNVTYTGKIVHKGKIYPGEHEAIINKKTFDQVQEIIKGNGNGSGQFTRNKHGALLKGLLYCASCGAAMAHTYTKKKNRLYRYYVCTTAQKQGPDACRTPSLPAQEIEDFVVEQIRQLANDPEMVEQVFTAAEKPRKEKIPRLKTEQKRLQRERQHKQEKIKELVAAVGASPEPVASFADSLQEWESAVFRIDQRLTEIKTELASIKRKTVDKDDVTAALASFGPVWDELYPAERTRIVNLVIGRVEYDARTDNIQILFDLTGI